MEKSDQRIKTYEGFFDRFKGEYGYRIGKKPKKNYGEKFLSLLEISVSDIQYLLTEITDVIRIANRPQNAYDTYDPERDPKFEYEVVFPGIDNKVKIFFAIKNDRFLPASAISTDPKRLAELIDFSQDVFSGDEFAFTIEFFTKDIYNDNSDTTFLKKVKTMNFNYTSLNKEKINVIKECGERICDMIEFEKFELDIKRPDQVPRQVILLNPLIAGYSLIKLIFKI